MNTKQDAYIVPLYIGDFTLKSGGLQISDPCLTHGNGTDPWRGFERAEHGNWMALTLALVENAERRIAQLIVTHEDHYGHHVGLEPSEPGMFSIGVDSGQAGFFDNVEYHNEENVTNWEFKNIDPQDFGDHSQWYKACCDQTMSNRQAGVIPYGVVASSGFGDGEYQYFTKKIKDTEIVGSVRLSFISNPIIEKYLDVR